MRRARHSLSLREGRQVPKIFEYFGNDNKTLNVADTSPVNVADTSPVGLGAVLIQEQQGVKGIISYASKGLSDVEKRY